jgi:hypothetical protein
VTGPILCHNICCLIRSMSGPKVEVLAGVDVEGTTDRKKAPLLIERRFLV